ncbi:cupin domain-containing protein [Salinisphaera sp. P385]|uniref:Cupin domain-containing protein n=1 Tax=Spectribacter acetivorans TaxID=3075603 RepID=A0ABU3B8V6_9GAMM|nr:cupin domain-containing protein [Salinisphaera sp. P385]MDT0618603.1 cupin domain-containing protein [Salinisphaera sp. P385]
MYEHQINPPAEPVDEQDTTLSVIELADVRLPEDSAPLEQRQLRFRRVDVGPGGIVPFHSHENRPAILFIIEGEIIEYNSRHENPVVHKAGSVVAEYNDVSHWWKNESESVVVIYAADLAQIDRCVAGEC